MEDIEMSEEDMEKLDDENVSKASLLKVIKEQHAKISSFARQLEMLLLENQTLRTHDLNLCGCNTEVAPQRKIAKSASNSDISVVDTSLNTKAVNHSGTSVKAASNLKVNKVANEKASVVKTKRKVFQVVDSNVFGVRKSILNAGCGDFNVKQNNASAPVKVSVGSDDAGKVREALKRAGASFHEFKLAEERSACFLIKGLVGVQESDLPDIKQQLTGFGLPTNILLTLFVTNAMRAKTEKTTGNMENALVRPESCICAL